MDDLQGAMPAAELKELLEQTQKGEMKQSLKNCVMVFRHEIKKPHLEEYPSDVVF